MKLWLGTFAHKQVSPDLNPLDSCLERLSEAVQRQCTGAATLENLRVAIMAGWENLPLETLRKSILQQKCRQMTEIRSKGGAIAHVYE